MLAVVYHLAIGVGMPLPEIVEWLASLGPALVVEFVTKDDPISAGSCGTRRTQNDDYDRHVFEAALERWFHVTDRQALSSGTRILYFAERRP